MIYRGTSGGLWVLEGIIGIFVILFVIWIGFVLLLIAAALIIAFFVWWGWLEFRDRWLDPPVVGLTEWEARHALYPTPPPYRHRLPKDGR
jgi:hypothetical protein